MSKLTDFLTGGSSDEPKEIEGEEEFYTTSKEEFHNTNGMAGSRMMLLEPRAYSESQQIADYLKNRSAVVVNLKRVTPDQAKRIIDFLSGTIYAIGGQLQKLGGGIFLATPNNYNIEGTITDEKAEKVARNGNGKKASDDEADFF
ncbi:MAG: cell division protein SepF [Bacilli bacterium]|jgi:cell division inhibitor SepF|nr:cell division protein SepF [Bacilli bacterium]